MAKGYTKINNSILDAMLSPGIRDAELKILLFFIRYTVGFHRNTVKASYSYIANGTGYSVDTVRNIVKVLMKKGIIKRMYQSSGSSAQVWVLSCERIPTSYVSTFTPDMGVESHLLMGVESHQEIKEEIINIEIKDKERASLTFLPCETSAMRSMDEADRIRYVEMLPENMRCRDPDDYSEEEWDIYDAWRCENGLI